MAAPKKRMANIELLRILAMLMVTMLHYLGKSGILPQLTGPLTVNGYLAWILELLSIAAVDIYMLISGFFLTETGFRTKRLIQLLCQVLFYSLLIPPVLIAFGVLKPSEITIYRLLYYILPTQMKHYWFISAYVMMYLFSPLLGIAVKSMKKNQLRAVIVLLLLFLSVNKSILPVRLEMDDLGYDGIWFMCVYLVAAYLRLYGLAELREWAQRRSRRYGGNRKNAADNDAEVKKVLAGTGGLGYLAVSIVMLLLTLGVRFLYLKTGQFETFISAVTGYNHILTLTAAVCLFVGFYHMNLKEGKVSSLILRIAPYTLGVYLLHEHYEVRYLWPAWLGANASGSPVSFLARCIFSVLLVFAAGILVDMVRGFLFRITGRLLAGSRVCGLLEKVDAMLAGRAG